MEGGAGMEGQPDAEPGAGQQLEHQRERAEDEWRLWQAGQVRSWLHLVSAVAQWVLLLACLIYLGVHFLRPSKTQSDKGLWTHIRYTGRSTRGAAVNLTAESGPIQIRNGSVLVPCDGLYLVSLRSGIYPDEEEEDWLKLTLQATSSVLWEQVVHSNDSRVNLTTVLYLFEQDSVTLWTSSNASLSDLSLSLVLVADNNS
ncbi:tumor necrosis factor ligand superfamily member 4 [Motacilla alba alba]|uniref:tumor necrosis factor ligand superfamily member 4 n=1 Tax=Motacilla alba alba TaxID=1094192 RepID=UPI0018D4E008|nr:tumor necrosis factor ligand superfamily member 4 [Motacilla alba alba]XP_038000172.1 tumor necrosis factor ligand superfamily member 4 [Motacilla alba alba]XP_038000173.1 tumor necrosis factor ligand superfamily member 4 [Motacilla alba alba]